MASIADLCWTTSEELFRDIDLDALYLRQADALDSLGGLNFPYVILAFTGKITIGIHPGGESVPSRGRRTSRRSGSPGRTESVPAGNPWTEPSE